MWYKSTGVLNYSIDPIIGPKLIALADPEIAAYYRALIPKHITVRRPKYPAHVSVFRKYPAVNMDHWGKYEGHVVEFEYYNDTDSDEKYVWLPVRSEAMLTIRRELGLPDRPWWTNGFHMTIGNFKEG